MIAGKRAIPVVIALMVVTHATAEADQIYCLSEVTESVRYFVGRHLGLEFDSPFDFDSRYNRFVFVTDNHNGLTYQLFLPDQFGPRSVAVVHRASNRGKSGWVRIVHCEDDSHFRPVKLTGGGSPLFRSETDRDRKLTLYIWDPAHGE